MQVLHKREGKGGPWSSHHDDPSVKDDRLRVRWCQVCPCFTHFRSNRRDHPGVGIPQGLLCSVSLKPGGELTGEEQLGFAASTFVGPRFLGCRGTNSALPLALMSDHYAEYKGVICVHL